MGPAEHAKLIGTTLNEMSALSGFTRRALEIWHNEQPCRFEVVAMGVVCKRTKLQLEKSRQLSKEELELQFNKECNIR